MQEKIEFPKYYACWIRLDRQDLYFVWYTDDPHDGVILDSEGRLPVFRTCAELKTFASTLNLDLGDEEPILQNLDVLAQWIKAPAIRMINCVEFLNSWNLFVDLESSIKRRNMEKEDKLYSRVYDMLFWGNNLPAVTPAGKRWTPPWRRKHVRELRASLEPRLKLFRSHLLLR